MAEVGLKSNNRSKVKKISFIKRRFENMSDIKNIFVSHYHTDAERIEDLKSLLGTHGMTMKDSSIYENKNPNNAHNEEYIKSIIRPQIDWAGTMVVLIGKDTSKSEYVNWEIEHAARETYSGCLFTRRK